MTIYERFSFTKTMKNKCTHNFDLSVILINVIRKLDSMK